MKVKHLWTTGSYDGMVTGVGRLEDGRHVFLDASESRGGWQKRERWQLLEDLLDELLTSDDAENIWDRIERGYEKDMYEDLERRFKVIEINQEQFEKLADKNHRYYHPEGPVLDVVGWSDIERHNPYKWKDNT